MSDESRTGGYPELRKEQKSIATANIDPQGENSRFLKPPGKPQSSPTSLNSLANDLKSQKRGVACVKRRGSYVPIQLQLQWDLVGSKST